MSDVIVLAAELREKPGRGAARAARRAGRVPAVVYGGKGEPINVSVDGRELGHEFEKGGFTNRLLDLKIDGESNRVLPREVQLHPVTDVLMHVDFLRLAEDSRIRIMVPASFVDDEESPGLKRGGVLNVVRHEIEFYCRADSIPEQIVISLAGLEIGEGIHISDIELPEGVTPAITDRDFTIATVAAPTIHIEEEVEAEEGEEEELEGAEEGAEEAEAEAAEGTAKGAGEEKESERS